MRTILLGIALLLSGTLIAQTNTSPPSSIRGNWFRTDIPNEWEYGIYDSVCILQNRIFTNKSINKQGDCIELTVQDKKSAKIETLRFTPQPNGDYLIQLNEAHGILYTKEGSTKPLMTSEADFKEFIRKDTAYIQGYIDRFDRGTHTYTNLIMMGNELTGEDCPTVVNINPDGSFECKLALNYPIENILSLGNHSIHFYIEPGQTLSIYMDDEGNYDSIRLMGPSAALSQMYDKLNGLFTAFPRELLSKVKEGRAPDLLKKELQVASAKCEQMSDSLAQIYAASEKAVHLIKNKLALEKGKMLLNFIAYRDMLAARDTSNQALKVKEGNDYYDFLKHIPLNDESLLVNWEYAMFINRFEFMNPLREVQRNAYENKRDKQILDEVEQYLTQGDSVISLLSGQANTFLWQTTLVRRLPLDLKGYSTPSGAKKHVNVLNKYLTYPILRNETKRIFDATFSKKADKTYQLPEGKATEIFRNIIKAHSGKILFIDFWATSCGGCRAGIEKTAQLRKDYKNHPEFQFIYITDERSSPKGTYDAYVAKNLEGEVSYRISDSEFKYLRELFKFNGIPHYELVEKDGSISKENVSARCIGTYLEKRFETPQASGQEQKAK